MNLFPELVGFTETINYDAIRPYIISGYKPIWQINIDGIRVKLWDSITEIQDTCGFTNLNTSISSNGERLSGGYSWRKATYDEIANPERPFVKPYYLLTKTVKCF